MYSTIKYIYNIYTLYIVTFVYTHLVEHIEFLNYNKEKGYVK